MKYLAIDAGTYSLKTILIKYERRQLYVLEANEYVLNEFREKNPLKEDVDQEGQQEKSKNNFEDENLKRSLIKSIIPEHFEGKVIYQLPNNYITSRHLELPVTQRKKVELMIPFQLDEVLPFSSQDGHFISQLQKKENSTSALINVAKKSEIKKFFDFYDKEQALPTVLTSELSVFHSFANNKDINGPIAILDIGHSTSKCYIFYRGQVISHHFSYCAGSAIDEVISETYQISLEDAVLYKHKNCFLLTEGQYNEVNDEQREFAILMKKTLTPLVMEAKRWLLGFRVQYGVPVETVYLTGGSSNIHNIGNFFSQNLGVKTDFATLGESIIDEQEVLTACQGKFFLSALMASNLAGKSKPGNFLIGDFSTGSSLTLPLHSIGFYMNRGAFLLVIMGLLFGVDIFFQVQDGKKLDRQIREAVKQKSLELSATDKRRWDNRLSEINKKIERKNKVTQKELYTLQAASNENGLAPLTKIFTALRANKDYEITHFETRGEFSKGKVLFKNKSLMKNVEDILKSTGLKGLTTAQNGDELTFNFEN